MSSRPSHTAHGMLVVVLLAQFAVVAGFDPARADAVHPHIRAEADRERVCQRDKATFGGRIGFGIRLRHQRARGCDIDDRTLGFAQWFFGRAGEQECGGQIDVDDALPFLQRQFSDRFALHDAGIGNKPVEPAKSRHGFANRAFDGGGIRDIAFDQDDVGGFRKGSRQSALGQIESGNRPAFAQKLLCDAMTDAVSGTGDKRGRRAGRPRAIRISALARSPHPVARPIRSTSRHRGFSAVCRWRRGQATEWRPSRRTRSLSRSACRYRRRLSQRPLRCGRARPGGHLPRSRNTAR